MPVLVKANEELVQISGVTIIDLYKPKENKEVNIDDLKLSSDNVEAVSFTWLIKDNNTYREYKEDTFKKNEDYALLLELKTSEGYTFADEFSISYNSSYLNKIDNGNYEKSGYYLKENGNVEVFIKSEDMPNSFDNILIGIAVLSVGIFTWLGNKFGNKIFKKGKLVKTNNKNH